MGPLVRGYVGIRLPDTVWPKLQETQMAIRKKAMSDQMRWNAPAETIVTLCALGEHSWEMIKRATSVLGPVVAKHPALNLRLEGLVGLPNPTQPRYIYLGVKGDSNGLCALQADVARALAPMLAPTEKAYQPLLQIGRLKIESEQARTMLGRALKLIPSEVLGEWRADAVEVFRTDAGPTGVHVESIERFPLG